MERGVVFVGDINIFIRRLVRSLVEKKPIRDLIDWAVAYSLWPVHLMTSCCGVELAGGYSPRYDLERYGSLPFVSPRQTNLIIIEGTLTRKMARVARITWEQMADPKFVIAMGACAIDGGLFWNSFNIVRANEVMPVDVYIPGCPPRPEALASAILALQDKIRKVGIKREDIEILRKYVEK
ncbi:MAG: NADH-quinone oxidoreductase subunit B [Desulfurococcales archaeon]|jgi:NADH-quinone oxidoreductase subunit B|nr:NADH-quinone oxidoreductase subunit NuoB [Desulfurococcales archaeon]MCI4457303.1 NADH-quinone oxidoreductase subunit NuoB [Desulfurococcaceae archaeon]NAZ14279.1 NADH-quinone oxidoreductase subunit B [Desulfurococcales archaeon]